MSAPGRPRQQPSLIADRQPRPPELADLGAFDTPTELAREQLHPVTDAQHRHVQLEQLAPSGGAPSA